MGHEQASTTLNRYSHAPTDFEDRVVDVFEGAGDLSLTSGPDDSATEGQGG